MSNNAKHFRNRLNEAEIGEPTLAEAADMVAEAAAEERRLNRLANTSRGSVYVSAAGVESLVNKAKERFIAAHGGVLPWNLDLRSGGDFGGTGLNYGPGNLGRNGRRMSKAEADEVLGQWAKFAGWLNAITDKHDATARMVVKVQGGGQGAKATHVNLWELHRRWPAPGKLEKMVRAVRNRGTAILSAYTGTPRVSNKGIALGLMAERTVGKAAVVAVAVTLGLASSGERFRYREARQALIDLHLNFPIVRTDDGITSRIGREPVLVDEGVAVYAAKFGREGRISLNRSGFLVVAGNRSYHVQEERYQTLYPAQTAAQAREAWARQDRYAAQEAAYQQSVAEAARVDAERRQQLVEFLDGTQFGACPLITREDSYTAGNCRPGTEEWVLGQGWRGREYIPGVWLISHLADPRVERVAAAARQRFLRDDLAQAA
ncbi:MAG: hypothetical protein WAX89_03050 [Alphaproteobacteria bacterium]